jgi:SRSO17 transposase
MATVECNCGSEAAIAGRCEAGLGTVAGELREHFRRPEAHRHAVDYLRGLLTEVERKNGWQLAEEAGYEHPRGIQRVLDRYTWDADAVRDDLLRWAIRDLGDPSGVVVVDESGFLKQGRESVGVARQYTGTAGKIANCQIGVFLGYASAKGYAGLDRALYLPQEWTDDRARCRRAGIPDAVPFRTKPQLALELLARALDGGVPAAWVVADEVYGSDGKFRRALEARAQAYVVAVRTNQPVSTWPPYGPPAPWTVVAAVAAAVTAGVTTWARRSCGDGVQGPRLYDWVYLPVRPALREGWVHAVLVRRHPGRLEELAYYLVYTPDSTPLDEIVRAAGARWTIEETFKLAKGQVGLDQYEVRSWSGWYRHITLALLALAALTIGAGQKRGRSGRPTPRVRSTSRSPSPRSAGSSSATSGASPTHHPPSRRSSPGPGGDGAIRRSPKPATESGA